MDDEEYYVYPEGNEQYSEHSEHLFCGDMSCPCHESQENINILNQSVIDGLASTSDADRIYRGQTV